MKNVWVTSETPPQSHKCIERESEKGTHIHKNQRKRGRERGTQKVSERNTHKKQRERERE